MTMFGDYDPEDAYDVGDPLRLRVSVLRHVAEQLPGEPDERRRERRRLDALRLLDVLDDETGDLVPALAEIRHDLWVL
jgi:hypothetical protein